ncbi:signal peptidase I [Bacillus sp. FJAT-27445]|uniref:signal peptidase I n=1 Tax=Bacillus sp. FJAT-27445 TaxID=1679166 RepID=UPI00074378CA|nr:signal peptidase I [Bacillus sp. FJAT-27445]
MENNREEILGWIKAIFIAILIAFLTRTFLLTPIEVDGASMNPTLQDHDRMIVTKIGELKRFDIVVFHANDREDYIKRIIGLPGDHIEYKDDMLFVNGKPYEEPYLEQFKKENPIGPLTDSFKLEDTAVGTMVVPKGHLFVMGDNRRNSKDSRHIGAIPIENVVGTTKVVYWPLKEMKIIKE